MSGPLVWKLLLILFNVHRGIAVIYHLNSTEYEKLPPVFYLDSYDNCMEQPGAVYCVTELVLVSDTHNQLLDTIHEYSAHTPKHFNHTLNRYGICLDSCENASNTTLDLRYTLEACFNKTYSRKYGLKTKLQENVRCFTVQREINFETKDIIFLVILIVILLMNIVGSLCDVCLTTPASKHAFGLRLLTLFSVRRNWRKLTAPAVEGPEPRLRDLIGISGLKVITTILVTSVHSVVTVMFYIDNPRYIEELYGNPVVQLLLNGTTVVQTFFVISGFLLVYNLLLFSESHYVGWIMLPKGILFRWIRLTPPYALLMFFAATCIRFVGSGPAWDIAVMDEVDDCNKYWWQHLFYINNYNNVSQCLIHTWYLAADTQLYCLGLVVFIACKSSTSRKVVLAVLLLAGLVIPPLLTYLQDLDGIVVFSPETLNHFFVNNLTYAYLYKPAYSNIFHYTIGLAVGYFVYHLQKINFDVQKYKKFRYLLWCLPFMGFGVTWSGWIFYWDMPRPSMLVRLAYAAFMKPVFSIWLSIGLVALVTKFENNVNLFLESKIWTVLGRLSYSTYLLHVTLLRIMIGTNTVETHVTLLFLFQQGIFLVVLSYSAAVPYWILVEQPLGQLMKVFVSPKEKK